MTTTIRWRPIHPCTVTPSPGKITKHQPPLPPCLGLTLTNCVQRCGCPIWLHPRTWQHSMKWRHSNRGLWVSGHYSNRSSDVIATRLSKTGLMATTLSSYNVPSSNETSYVQYSNWVNSCWCWRWGIDFVLTKVPSAQIRAQKLNEILVCARTASGSGFGT